MTALWTALDALWFWLQMTIYGVIVVVTFPVWILWMAVKDVSTSDTNLVATTTADALVIGFGQAATLALACLPLALVLAGLAIWLF